MDKRLTQRQLENVLRNATLMCLRLDPDNPSEEVQKRIRFSWPNSETGNSDWKREENIVFLRITPGSDPYTLLRDVTYRYDSSTDKQIEEVSYYRHYSVNFIFYGPNSSEDADAVRIGLYREAIKQYLQKNRLAPLTGAREPVRVPEIDETGEWWERSDLFIEFYERVQREYESETVLVAPNIIMQV